MVLRGRRVFFVLTAILILAFLFYHGSLTFTPPSFKSPEPILVSSGHPISKLVEDSQARFENLLSRQSRTLQDARDEYYRRYRRRPPLGFEAWFRLAQDNDFVLIDEFDTFMHSLQPYFGIPPGVIKNRIQSALKLKPDRLLAINVENGNVSMSRGVEAIFFALMPNRDWLKFIPYNMTLLINDWDEPMVSASFDERAEAVKNAKSIAMNMPVDALNMPVDALSVSFSQLEFTQFQKENTWAVTSQACSMDSPSRQSSCPREAIENSFNFINNLESRQNVCQNCDLLSSHGLLLCPGNLDVAHSLVPIWSASKPSHFSDILYPSAYYSDLYFPETRTVYKPSTDQSWHKKQSKFYWTGASTGGWGTPETWHRMQRQRLVLKTNNRSESIQLLEKQPESRRWQPRPSTMNEISDLFSTRITRLVQCDENACEMEQDAFGLGGGSRSDPYEAAYRYKFVFDIDGNGFSGRFYRLLQSRSVVVKQTILSEWHDDRLIPWVHYVPLSTSYDELPELARFLATTEEGLWISEQIAKDSTEWHDKALRDIDLQLVWLRAMLEFGRVMNPDMHE